MRATLIILCLFISNRDLLAQSQILQDNFEGNSTISTWAGDDCGMDTNFVNPFQNGINTSSTVLKYTDGGGLYANIRFDAGSNFNLSKSSVFTLKVYVPSNDITGSQTNQISLKLQNASLSAPWSTQCEIIKTIVLDQWQTITFDFSQDAFINFDPNSANPLARNDFNRVLFQMNGENNNDKVVAYFDDFLYSAASSVFTNLVWSDEFDQDGAVNTTKWFHQTQLPNGVSWYNNELQHYTNRSVNSFCEDGVLNIVAKKESFTDQGQTKQYTSSRLNSKYAFKYGRIEARMKLPIGEGTWPAFWMLGKNIIEPGGYWTSNFGTKNWPACGEIDIMEHWGSNQNVVSSAVHHPINGNLAVGEYSTGDQYRENVSTEFHVYAVEWNEKSLIFTVDGIRHLTYNPLVKDQYTWPFDAEQYILLNFAIEPRVSPNYTQSTMQVDYVRVYQEKTSNTDLMAKAPQFKVFPNPVVNELSIHQFENTNAKVEICSLSGQILKSLKLNKLDTAIDVTDMPAGVYILKIVASSGSETFKFIKE